MRKESEKRRGGRRKVGGAKGERGKGKGEGR